MKKLFSVLILGFLINVPAHANLLLEPYLQYGVGSWDDNNGNNQTQKGASFGGRVGYQSLGFMMGGDFMTGSWTDNATTSNTITPTDLGVFVGFNFPLFLRVWGTYDFSAQRKFSALNDTFKGSDVKLGLGLTMFPLISVNFEYVMGTFNKDSVNGTLVHNLTDKLFFVGVSLPLNF
jgi:hypothetical protein